MRRALFASLSLSLLLYPMLTGAVRFPDVPGDHPYNSSVEALAIEGVVTGNPDGYFYPARPVNRAEFLTMLYRATKKTSGAVSVSCFSDVNAAAWYAAVVCDAVVEGYVGGYPDGSFKPEQSVNRVEALKMLYKVFGLGVLTGDSVNDSVEDFTDVQANAWYTTYVSSSYRNGLLPIPGYQGNKFYPTNALLRGEAAAYIWRAMNITGEFEPNFDEEESSSSSSSAETSSSSSARATSQRSSASVSGTTSTMQVDFPFTDGGDVDGRKTMVYTFPLNESSDIEIEAKIGSGNESGITCRLYLLGESGLSEQYYLGFEHGSTCTLKVSVPKGEYQLEVRPAEPTATFEVFTKMTNGDGNDGFDEASLLLAGKPKAGQLAVSDVADWYKFTLGIKGMHTVAHYGDDVTCLIYPLNNVDIFGFSTPLCGEAYEYPKGSYVVRIQRANGVDESLTYSVQLD